MRLLAIVVLALFATPALAVPDDPSAMFRFATTSLSEVRRICPGTENEWLTMSFPPMSFFVQTTWPVFAFTTVNLYGGR